MGTASTMASMVEALGIGLPDNAAIPAVDSRRGVLAQLAGRRIVEMVREDLTMSQILTRQAFENAIRVNGAIGGSTNAVMHLLAIAGRVGVDLGARRLGPARPRRADHRRPDAVGPLPDGGFLLCRRAAAVMASLDEAGLLHRDALTVSGKTIGEIDRRRAQLQQRGHPPARRAADQAKAASRCCAATWRPTAPSSSRRRRRRR